MIRRTRLVVTAAWCTAACGGDAVSVRNVNPEGSVGGIVVDAQTRAPLEGVSVSLLAGGRVFDPEATDAAGTFRFTGVPAGDVIVTVTGGDGYNDAFIRGTLVSAAGDYPVGNATLTLGPIGLLPKSGNFRFRVLDQFGAPVSGYPMSVELQVQYVDFSGGQPVARGQIAQAVQTDGDGYATVVGLPDFFALGSVNDALLVFLPPLDADGDGIDEFSGGDAAFNLRSLDPTPDVVLDGDVATALTVRASTIAQLAGAGGATPAVVQPTGKIDVLFNLPIQPTVDVLLMDEQGVGIAVPTSALSVRDDSLTINLSPLALDFGHEYNLALHAVAAVGERFAVGDFAAPFFTVSTDADVSVIGAQRDPVTQVVTITFNEPIGGIGTSLSGGNCVVFFGFDINGANGQGDAINELGNPNCNVTLSRDEWDPPGLPGPSGYTTRWQFTAPLQTGGTPIPAGITVHLLFDHAVSQAARVERVDGRAVRNLTFPLP